jgi:chaperonin GroES
MTGRAYRLDPARPGPERFARYSLCGMAQRDEAAASDDVKQSIRMTADRLLVRPSKEAGERKSRSGILIPATAGADRRLVWGEVIALGPTVRNVEPHDRVLFSPESGYEVDIRGDDYLILRERDIHAVASERSEGATGLYL